MNVLGWKKKGMLLSVVFVLCFGQVSFASDNTSFKEMTYEGNVELDKQWSVKVSTNIDSDTVTSENIQIIADETKDVVPIDCKVDPEHPNCIKIIPTRNYSPQTTYTIYVKDIKSVGGKVVKDSAKKQFTTKKIGTTTATAKVEVSPLVPNMKRITVYDSSIPGASYFKVGVSGELKDFGQSVVATESVDNSMQIYLYAQDASYLGNGVLNIKENGPRRVFDIDTEKASGETEGNK